jgi:hypothetical protein
MSMPFVDGDGQEIYTGFGVQAADYHELVVANQRRSDETINGSLPAGLGGRPLLASMQSNQGISDVTTKNGQHVQLQSDTGMGIGNRFMATVDSSTATLTFGDSMTA